MKTSVLVLTIIAASFSLLMGIGAGACMQGVGEFNRSVGNLHQASDAQTYSGMLVLAGLVQCAVGGFGGYKAFRTFGTKQSIKWGLLPLVGAGLISISNTCSFFTSGILFFVAAFLTFLGSRQASESQATATESQAVPENAGPSIGNRIKAAGQLAAKQAQRTSLATMTLPSAYRALGKYVFKSGTFREEFSGNYVQLDNINAELKAIVSQAGGRPTADGLAAKAKGAALAAKNMAQTKTVELRGKQALAALGEVVFEKHGEQSGPAEVVRPIMDTRMQIVALDDEIASLSGSGSGQLLTPKRIAIAGVVLVALIALGIIGNLTEKNSSSNSNRSTNSESGVTRNTSSDQQTSAAPENKTKSQPERVIAGNLTKAEFVDKLRQTMTRGRIDSSVASAVFENNVFQNVFGDPDSDVQWMNYDRLYTYRCSDGQIQLKVAVSGPTIVVQELNKY